MKRVVFLAVLLMSLMTSCYKDDATFTFEVGGSDNTFLISYQDKYGKMVDNVTVPNGWQYWAEHSDDFKLLLKVTGTNSSSTIVVKLYKRTSVIKTYNGTGELMIDEIIQH